MLCAKCQKREVLNDTGFCSICGTSSDFELTLGTRHMYVGQPAPDHITLTMKHTGSVGEIHIKEVQSNQPWLKVKADQIGDAVLRPGSLITVPVEVDPMAVSDNYHAAVIEARSDVGSALAMFEIVPRPEITIFTGEYTIFLDLLHDEAGCNGYLEVTRGVITVKNLSTDVSWVKVELSDGGEYPHRLDARFRSKLDFRFVFDENALMSDIERSRRQPPVDYHGNLVIEYVEFGIRRESFHVKCYLPPALIIPEEIGQTVRVDALLGKRKEIDITLQNGDRDVTGRAALKIFDMTIDQEWLRPATQITYPLVIPSGSYHQISFVIEGAEITEGFNVATLSFLTNLPAPNNEPDLFVDLNVLRMQEFGGTLAIDFGTTNCSCAYIDEFGRSGLIEIDPDSKPNATSAPSAIIYWDSPDGQTREFEIGRRAYEFSFHPETQHSTVVRVSRQLGRLDKIPIAFYRNPTKRITLLPRDVASDIIGRMLERAEEQLQARITRCTICHPSRFSLQQIEDLKAAVEACGINRHEITTISEAVAAAWSFIQKPAIVEARSEYSLMVYDFGGGHTDITLMRVVNEYDEDYEFYIVRPQVLGSTGDNWFGGEEITDMVMDIATRKVHDLLQERYPDASNIVLPLDQKRFEKAQYRVFAASNRLSLKGWAEASKIALAQFGDEHLREMFEPTERPDLDIQGMRLALMDGVRLTVIIDGAVKEEQFAHADAVPPMQEIEDRLRPKLEELVAMMKELASIHLIEQPDIILLSGKSSAFELVRTVIHERFTDSTIDKPDDPGTCVVEGACFFSSTIMRAGIDVHIAAPLTTTTSRLGIRVNEAGQVKFRELVGAGVPIPPTGLLVPLRELGRLHRYNVISILENSSSEDELVIDGQENRKIREIKSYRVTHTISEFEEEHEIHLNDEDLAQAEIIVEISPSLDIDLLVQVAPNLLRDREADRDEHKLRNQLARHEYERAGESLEAAKRLDPARADRLLDEFGFLLTADAGQGGERLRWCTQLWRVLSNRNWFPLNKPEPEKDSRLKPLSTPLAESGGTEAPVASDQHGEIAPSLIRKADQATPEKKGERLEEAVARLFSTFFELGDDVPWKIRRQRRGTQGGFDLSIEWSGKCESATEQKSRCHIECKNYRDPITPGEVAGKLLSEPTRDPVIDHWILISPRSNPSNELNRFLELQDKERRFPFEIQVWCPETGVDEFFGLEPTAYDSFISPPEGKPHPATWDEARRNEVRARWRARLNPPLRLPRGWKEYLDDPSLLCIYKEVPDKMERDYETYVPMRCRNLAGALLERPLESYVRDWLEAPDKSALFLLGEFGDGKSFFTYVLARRLIEQIKHQDSDPASSWVPLRLALVRFPSNARDFLRQRLEEFNADVGGWKELSKTSRLLVILDGFDEISVKLDPDSITQNIRALLECAQEFEGCKLMITSRTHFFQNKEDAQRLLERLGQPPAYQLAPISRDEVLEHLKETLSDSPGEQALRRIHSMNDPIGLATKPLFLEMLKEVLSAPDLPEDLDVVTLYERYIEQSLNRKRELLDDANLKTRPQETIANLKSILGEIAEELQQTGQDYLPLSKYKATRSKPFAELLWKLSGGDETCADVLEKDAIARVGARSLLARVLRQDIEEEWPVVFCHRSMQEYFVSIRLCQAVEEGEESGFRFLRDVPLNHEILSFAVEQWHNRYEEIAPKLLAIIQRAVPSEKPGPAGGHALTLLYRLKKDLPKEFDWTGKVFDGADMEEAEFSGMDFSRSSFRGANLANVNLENSKFEHADLTGVRIEETAHVVSLGVDPSGERIVAAYADGLLRQWRIQPNRRIESKVVGNLKVEPSSVIGIHESGQPWMRVGREWLFFDAQPDGTWSETTRFTIKDEFEDPHPQGDLMTLVEHQADGSLRITLVDLNKQRKLTSLPANAARHCAAPGTSAVIWTNAESGVVVRSLARRSPQREIVLPCPEPTCLNLLSTSRGTYLVAAGTGEGWVHCWELDLGDSEWSQRAILEVKAHDGPVTSLVFQSSGRIASGGSDRSIALINYGDGPTQPGAIEHRLLLRLRCKGMRIEGLQTEAERQKLTRLIEEGNMCTAIC